MDLDALFSDSYQVPPELPPTAVDPSLFVWSSGLHEIILFNFAKERGVYRKMRCEVLNNYHSGNPILRTLYVKTFDGVHSLKVDPYYLGCEFEFHVLSYEGNTNVQHLTFSVHSERSLDEQHNHLDNIFQLVLSTPDWSMQKGQFYRVVDEPYLRSVQESDGLLRPVLRKKSSHPYNMAFNLFPCMYFCATTKFGSLPSISPYGTMRMIFPASKIFTEKTRLFLVDMHCYYPSNHYILLAIANEGSATSQKLREKGARDLDIQNNPFLKFDPETGDMWTADYLRENTKIELEEQTRSHVWIEMMVADRELNINDARIDVVAKKEYKSGGTPRVNNQCELCTAVTLLDQNIFLEP